MFFFCLFLFCKEIQFASNFLGKYMDTWLFPEKGLLISIKSKRRGGGTVCSNVSIKKPKPLVSCPLSRDQSQVSVKVQLHYTVFHLSTEWSCTSTLVVSKIQIHWKPWKHNKMAR